MQLTYYPRTDSLYIDLSSKSSVDSREVSDGIVLDYDADGDLVGIDIDHASQKLEIKEIILRPWNLTSSVFGFYYHEMSYRDIITIEPEKRGGKPCIRGMRITVYDVLEYLASGMTQEEILEDFPYLTKEDILACLSYAADHGDQRA